MFPTCASSLWQAQKLISLCGWEPRWLLNVQDCEEHSAQSARNGHSFGPGQTQIHLPQDPGPKAVSASAKMDSKKAKVSRKEPRLESRSPLLDCSLCGATVRVAEFLTVPRPSRFTPNNIDIPETSKKLGLTRGVSAASGISGWVAADDTEKDQTEDRDEVTTTNEGKFLANTDVDLTLSMAGGFPCTSLGRTATSEKSHDVDMGRDLMIGQPSGSEIGDRAASYESRGPSSRKRNLEKGGSSDDRPVLGLQQQADSVEGTVIDCDGDEVTDSKQYSAGPSKRSRVSDIFDCSPHQKDSSGAGPSHSVGFEAYAEGNRVFSFLQENERPMGRIRSARNSTCASSVIAMDIVCHDVNDDSMESVENYPGDLDDVHFPSSSNYGNVDMNETSELNNSNQVQQSVCLQTATEVAPGEMGVSSTNYGEEIFNAETAQVRDGISLGVSGGSVGMCASHEAEIHGADISVHRADSVVGDMEPRVEDAENQGQTGESTPDPGLMDEIVPDMNREDPNGDNQEMLSHSAARTDSGSKIGCTTKAESVESGEKISQNCNLPPANSSHPSRSCNAIVDSGCGHTKEETMKDGKSSFTNNCAHLESDFAIANGIGNF